MVIFPMNLDTKGLRHVHFSGIIELHKIWLASGNYLMHPRQHFSSFITRYNVAIYFKMKMLIKRLVLDLDDIDFNLKLLGARGDNIM